MAVFKDAAHRHRELFTAVIAHEQTGPGGVTGNTGDAQVNRDNAAAVRRTLQSSH